MGAVSVADGATICAIATPPGVGGIGIVRLSGAQAREALARVFVPLNPAFTHFRPWTLHRGRLLDADARPIDDVLAVYMPAPRTFTGEDVTELHCHGGPAILRAALEALLRLPLDMRLAAPGEFSRRALLNGRMDLTQAEAVAEMVAAPSRQGLYHSLARLDGRLGQQVQEVRTALEHVRQALCLAVDFPDDEVECLSPAEFAAAVGTAIATLDALLASHERARCWQEGARVVLGGAVNAGKSSLLNALVGRNRALVTDIPGTTRDYLEEYLQLDGLPLRLTDTAGLRPPSGDTTPDPVELLGIERSRQCLDGADVVVLVLDGAEGEAACTPLRDAARAWLGGASPVILVWNKADLGLPDPLPLPADWREAAWAVCTLSAKTGAGLEEFCHTLRRCVLTRGGRHEASGLDARELAPDVAAPNLRQAELLRRARGELACLEGDITSALPYDVCAVRLDAAVALLGEVLGLHGTEEVLNAVFATFCIGK